jgi:hypothetical protein
MMKMKLLDVVALTEDLPEYGLIQGQVGTVVEELPPDAYEIEFSDDQGHTYASAGVPANKLIVLHYRPAKAA